MLYTPLSEKTARMSIQDKTEYQHLISIYDIREEK